MNKSFYTLLFLSLFTLGLSAQNITPEMLEKAKQMGVTDTQIKNATSTPKTNQTVSTGQSSERENIQIIAPERKDSIRSRVFGSEIFATDKLSFEPNYNMPTPVNYTLAPADEVIINIWGTSEQNYSSKISPEGSISIPNIGLIYLSGQTITQAENTIKEHLSQIYSGVDQGDVKVKVSLGQMRSIKVHLSGEVLHPGTYTLPSLTTLFNALYAAGGVNDIGTLRDIKVRRNGKEIASLDVYEYIINGKYNSNIRLADEDMIIVNPYKKHITISGKVKRNRIFELKDNETLSDLLRYAGGFSGEAYTKNIQIDRKTGSRYQIYTVESADFSKFKFEDADQVTVGKTIPKYENIVSIFGAAWRSGDYQLSESVNSIKKLIAKAEGLMGDAYLKGAILKRQKEDFTYQVIPLDLESILNGTSADISLKNEDVLYIPSVNSLKEAPHISVRGEVNGIRKLTEEEKLNSDINKLRRGDSSIENEEEGMYTMPFMDGITVQDALILAGGFKESASEVLISVVRRNKNPLSRAYIAEKAKTFTINLSNGLDATTRDFVLEPFDQVIVRKSPGYAKQRFAKATGEVLIEGQYAIDGQTRLSDLVKAAGGLTPISYAKGAQLRRKLSQTELARLEAKVKLIENNNKDSSNVKQAIEIPKYELVGINLEEILEKPKSDIDIVLQEGDVLVVPEFVNTVKISGAVYFPNTTVYSRSLSFRDYISKAGGYTQDARKRPYVVYANGQVASKRTLSSIKIEPGCEIIVPIKKKGNPLSIPEIMSMTTSATSVAALIASILK